MPSNHDETIVEWWEKKAKDVCIGEEIWNPKTGGRERVSNINSSGLHLYQFCLPSAWTPAYDKDDILYVKVDSYEF